MGELHPEDDTVCAYCGYPDCRCDDDDEPVVGVDICEHGLGFDEQCDDCDDDGDPEGPEEECHGWLDAGVFVCGGVGSEQCDECSCYSWLGLTSKEIDELEEMEDG